MLFSWIAIGHTGDHLTFYLEIAGDHADALGHVKALD